MHNISKILDFCFHEVQLTDFVEVIPRIPIAKSVNYYQCWHIITEISVNNSITEIDLYVGFSKEFPYALPEFYFVDHQYDYFPHIDYENRKLCLYEDGVIFNTENPQNIVSDCIKQAKRVVYKGVNGINRADFRNEIESYWIFSYDNEKTINPNWILYGLPKDNCILNVLINSERLKLIVADNEMEEVKKWFHPILPPEKILYLHNYQIPDCPPFDICWHSLKESLDIADTSLLDNFIRKYSTLNILFPLNSNTFGGIYCGKISTERKGFRSGALKPHKVLDIYYKKSKSLRFMAKLYSPKRIEERTCGEEQKHHNFAVVGCGSIGSNLCYYLNAFCNTSFLLIDNDLFKVDNIGRHLLGFSSVYSFKADSIKKYLLSLRPEMKVKILVKDVPNIDYTCVAESSAVFCCTGNIMAELCFLNRLQVNNIMVPKFLIWLEPYAIAGHMVYLNLNDGEDKLKELLSEDYFYKLNLIAPQEYKKPDAFIKRDAGCNGAYTNYSGNDVVKFLSALYPYICDLIDGNQQSACYRWVGNLDIAIKKGINLTETNLKKNQVNIFPILPCSQ